jgi:hypothetical protein
MSTSMSETNGRESGGRIAWRRLPLAGLLAAIAAIVGNTLVFLLSSAAGAIPSGVVLPSVLGQAPFSLLVVAVTTLVAVFWAAVAYAVVALLARRPARVFTILATVVLLLSFASPATIPGPPLSMRLALAAMHVVAWVASVGVLTTLTRPQEAGS